MTNKSKRQRGSRTHGGGSQKNRRGAGNRGGRGDAGRSKHEFHNHEKLGRGGFKGPNSDLEVETENIKDIDLILYEAEVELRSNNYSGPTDAEADGGAYVKYDDGIWLSRTEAPSLVDLTQMHPDADKTKLLSEGYLNRAVDIRADDCSREAKREVKYHDGTFYHTTNKEVETTAVEKIIGGRFKKISEKGENTVNLEQYWEIVNDNETLVPEEADEVLQDATSDIELAYDILSKQSSLLEDPSGIEIFNIMRARDFADKYDLNKSPFEDVIREYFRELSMSDAVKEAMIQDLPDEMSVEDTLRGLEWIQDDYDIAAYEDKPEIKEKRMREDELQYLYAVDQVADWS